MNRLTIGLTTLLALALPLEASAQVFDGAVYEGLLLTGPHFFISIVAGVVLAFAFQFVLTNISVAAGVSALQFYPRSSDDDDSSMEVTGKKVTSGIGLWSLITASIALFFATWLAVELALVPSVLMGVVLGLVVWGVFFLVLVLFETTAMASLVGTVVATALGGLRAAYQGTTGMFKSSPEDKVADIATEATKAIKDELARDVDVGEVEKVIDGYVKRISKPAHTPEDFRKEFARLLDDAELRSVAIAEGPGAFEIDKMFTSLETRSPLDSKSRESMKQGLSEAINTIKQEHQSQKRDVDSAFDAALRLTGMERHEAEHTRRELERYLRETDKIALNPEGIKRDLKRIFEDPSAARDSLAARFRSVDRDTVAGLIAQRDDVSRKDANQIVDSVISTVESMRSQFHQGSDELDRTADVARERVEGARKRLQSKARGFIESIDDPAIDYGGLERDVRRIFGSGDTTAGIESMKHRIDSMDRDTIVEIVSAHPQIRSADAEQMVQTVERARDKVDSRLTRARLRAERKLKETKIAARKRAEEAREVVAYAAWWAVASAVVSGFAAALGGVVAVSTGM